MSRYKCRGMKELLQLAKEIVVGVKGEVVGIGFAVVGVSVECSNTERSSDQPESWK